MAAPEHGAVHVSCRPAGRKCIQLGNKLQGIRAQMLGSCRAAPPLRLGPDLRPLSQVSTCLQPSAYLPLSFEYVLSYIFHDGLRRVHSMPGIVSMPCTLALLSFSTAE